MKDKALEELFLAQKPHFDDKVDFMASLTRRLDAVEYVRQHQEATIRRYDGCCFRHWHHQRSRHISLYPFHTSRHTLVHHTCAIKHSPVAR